MLKMLRLISLLFLFFLFVSFLHFNNDPPVLLVIFYHPNKKGHLSGIESQVIYFRIYHLFNILNIRCCINFPQKDNISVSVCWKIFDVYLQSIIWIKDTIMWCCCDVQGSCWGQRWAGVRYSGPGGLDASLEKWYKGYIRWLPTGKGKIGLWLLSLCW